MAYTRAQFRDEIRRRLGWGVHDRFAEDDELHNALRDSARELWALLRTLHRPGTWGINVYRPFLTGSVGVAQSQGAGAFVDLTGATRIAEILEVRWSYASRWHIMDPWDPERRSDPLPGSDLVSWTPGVPRYRHFKQGPANPTYVNEIPLEVYPAPAGTVQLWIQYLEAPPEFTTEASTSWMGEDEYLILDVCRKMAAKEEQDIGPWLAQLDRYRERLEMTHRQLDTAGPRYMQDGRGRGMGGDSETAAYWWRRI